MEPIFICYRRDDGIDTTQLLRISIENIFGENNVFLDTTSLKGGDVWPAGLRDKVSNSKVFLVVIGPEWKGNKGMHQLTKENDWVRKEIEEALNDKDKKIIPILIKGAKLPDANEIPETIYPLLNFQSIALREKEFTRDILQLVLIIEQYVTLSDPLKDLPINENIKYPDGSPFKGLDYFKEEDAKIFFGRGTEIRKLYNNICQRKLVLLYGQSGSGKSSLLFAGLKPRVENKGWEVIYIRRETGTNLAKELDLILSSKPDLSKHLIILDQVEEIFTNPDRELSTALELQQLVETVKNAIEKVQIIISFRKEFLAEIEKIFSGVQFEKIYLDALQKKGVLEAIRGISLTETAKDIYDLKFTDDEVPLLISQTVLSDEESQVAPLLQMILQKMWDEVANRKPRIFSRKLFNSVKSNNLALLLLDQIKEIEKKFWDEVNSGLVLDILFFFTTTRGTSASYTEEEITDKYDWQNILMIIIELKNKYLLTEPGKEDDFNTTRLAHDSLAPLIREMYAQSILPGQKAARLLDSKQYDIETGSEVIFSRPDLIIIEAGKKGMRKLNKNELKAIEESNQRIQQAELELKEKNEQLEIALVEAKNQALLAKAKALAASARQFSTLDPTLALRLAVASNKLPVEKTKETRSALADVVKQNLPFYEKIIDCKFQEGEYLITLSPCNKWVLTAIDDNFKDQGEFNYKESYKRYIKGLNGNTKAILKGTFEGDSDAIFSADGKKILTGGSRGIITLWDDEGNELQVFKGHNYGQSISNVVFSPDEKYILSSSLDHTVRLWDNKGNCLHTIDHECGWTIPLAFAPDGKSFIIASGPYTAVIYDLKGNILQTFKRLSQSWTYALAFSPNGKFVVTGDGERFVFLWDTKGNFIKIFQGHTRSIWAVAFSKDSQYILTASQDNTVRLWSLDGKCLNTFQHNEEVYQINFTTIEEPIFTLSRDNTIRCWNFKGNVSRIFENKGVISSVIFSSDGERILSGSFDHNVELKNLNGETLQIYKGHTGFIRSACFSPDEKIILTGSADKTARLWDINGKCIRILEGHEGEVDCARFSLDGRWIATGSNDKTLRLWDTNGNSLKKFEGNLINKYSPCVNSLIFSHDGQFIITGCHDSTIRIWEIKTGDSRIFKGHSGGVESVCLSNDGKYILSANLNGTICIWDMQGNIVQNIKAHSGIVSSASFSPDGKFIITTSFDRTARLWNLDGNTIQIFEGHSDVVNDAAFSPDGKLIVTGSHDKTIRIWNTIWEIVKSENIALPTPEQMKEYEIPEDINLREYF